MRVFIIGIDGLEHDFVENLNLRNIKQKEYGKVAVSASKLLTPLLWASFITGTIEHGVKSFTVRRNPIIKVEGSLLQKLVLTTTRSQDNSCGWPYLDWVITSLEIPADKTLKKVFSQLEDVPTKIEYTI